MNTLQIYLLTPFVASLITYLFGRICAKISRSCNPSGVLALLSFFASFVFLVKLRSASIAGAILLQIGMVELKFDGIALLFGLSTLLLGTLVAAFSIQYIHGEEGEEKFYALLILLVGTILGLVCTTDLFNLWVWFEAMAISSYFLVAFHRNQPEALEAAIKYLLQSAIGTAMILFGIAIVLSQTGSLSFAAIRSALPTTPFLWAAGCLFTVGFGIKAALVPLHTWLPDAHSQAPSGISAMLSGIVIEAGLIAMLRSLATLGAAASTWGLTLIIFGAVNMFLGNLLAFHQEQVKRLLAFSSVAHIGYMLTGIGIALTYHSQSAAMGGFFHLFTHSLMKGSAFLSAGGLLFALHLSKKDHGPLTVSDLDGAAQRYPMLALTSSIAFLALAGLPPFAGFMSKWQIMLAGFETKTTLGIAAAVFAALNSILSLGYYAPLVNRMYKNTPSAAVQQADVTISYLTLTPLVVATIFIIALGCYPIAFSQLGTAAATSLFAVFGG